MQDGAVDEFGVPIRPLDLSDSEDEADNFDHFHMPSTQVRTYLCRNSTCPDWATFYGCYLLQSVTTIAHKSFWALSKDWTYRLAVAKIPSALSWRCHAGTRSAFSGSKEEFLELTASELATGDP